MLIEYAIHVIQCEVALSKHMHAHIHGTRISYADGCQQIVAGIVKILAERVFIIEPLNSPIFPFPARWSSTVHDASLRPSNHMLGPTTGKSKEQHCLW